MLLAEHKYSKKVKSDEVIDKHAEARAQNQKL